MYYGIAILSRVVDLVALGNNDAREAGAIREYAVLNLRYRWRDRDAREAGATLESIIPNLRYRWRDRDAREVGATLERPLLYLRFPLRYDDLAILDVVAVFLVFFHDSIYFRFVVGLGEEFG